MSVRKRLFAFVAISALGMTACSSNQHHAKKVGLTLSSQSRVTVPDLVAFFMPAAADAQMRDVMYGLGDLPGIRQTELRRGEHFLRVQLQPAATPEQARAVEARLRDQSIVTSVERCPCGELGP